MQMLLKDTTAMGTKAMEHSQAVEQMAAERYLLNELTPEAREAFEEHVFDCPDCALDLRAAAAFVDEAKAQLPAPHRSRGCDATRWRRRQAQSQARSMVLLAASVLCGSCLRRPARGHQLSESGDHAGDALRGSTSRGCLPGRLCTARSRGGARTTISADREHGVDLPIDLTPLPGSPEYGAYAFDLIDSQGKTVWTGSIAAPPSGESSAHRISLSIRAAMLRNGTYKVAVFRPWVQLESARLSTNTHVRSCV